ncbi:hypothetical protein DPMN_120962 [Dreissena polymorpha]|uniref:Uncharacterized protein n=1 Tax=Dreissena polymorpha TaxID=45954 RepID=A0A9D4JSN7_DREPO|nr:hypothetical protein DPMN_120962 [Dreissena polymorpha]
MLDSSTITNNIKEVLVRKRRNNKRWARTKIVYLCNKRRELRHKKYTSLDFRTEYQKANRGKKKKIKNEKEEWIDEPAPLTKMSPQAALRRPTAPS